MMIRQKIIETALDITEKQGIKALTQPRLAKAAGIRQSHLTYYFPRKADLFVAILEALYERVQRRHHEKVPDRPDNILDLAADIILDRERMRVFIGVVLEAGYDPELRASITTYAAGLNKAIAAHFRRTPDDPAIVAFIDTMRGMGLRALLVSDDTPIEADPRELASRLGLL